MLQFSVKILNNYQTCKITTLLFHKFHAAVFGAAFVGAVGGNGYVRALPHFLPHVLFNGVFSTLAQISENVPGAGRTAQQAENGESDE